MLPFTDQDSHRLRRVVSQDCCKPLCSRAQKRDFEYYLCRGLSDPNRELPTCSWSLVIYLTFICVREKGTSPDTMLALRWEAQDLLCLFDCPSIQFETVHIVLQGFPFIFGHFYASMAEYPATICTALALPLISGLFTGFWGYTMGLFLDLFLRS
jgi:hypothetical protein